MYEGRGSGNNGKQPEAAYSQGSSSSITDGSLNEPATASSPLPGLEDEALLADDDEPEVSVSTAHLVNLTIGVGGLQVVWSVILSRGSPYLMSLGLSKSLTALVWLAAPLSGSVFQPLVGSMSDRTSTRWGRRRPFLIGGTLGIIVSVLFLAWAQELVHRVVVAFGGSVGTPTTQTLVLLFATIWVYGLNLAIQPVQFGLRSLIVENCPSHQQPQASTYASLMTGVGNIIGYFFGFGILPEVPSDKVTTFQMLCIFSSLCLSATVLTSCVTISEQPTSSEATNKTEARALWTILRDLYRTYRTMPSRIRRVCQVQFLAWIGWFPFLFYSTTYVGEICMGDKQPNILLMSVASRSKIPPSSDAIRRGTFANFLFAIVAFIFNVLIPRILKIITNEIPPKSGPRHTSSPIAKAWTYSHAFFAILMFSTIFVSSQMGATAVVALAGLSWAITLFAPFAIISTELARQQALQQDLAPHPDDPDFPDGVVAENQTGAVIGLHNIAISAPQILSALVCGAIYAFANAVNLQDSTGWVLRFGGLAALGAAFLCRRFE